MPRIARPRFRIWYDNGTVWDSAVDGPWDAAPSEGVQCVLIHCGGDYQEIVQGEDEYRLPELGRRVKYGRWMDGRSYNALIKNAINEGWS
jgi:hypothetical protein